MGSKKSSKGGDRCPYDVSITRRMSSASSSSSSIYTSTDDTRQDYSDDKRNFFDSDDVVGTVRLLRTYSPSPEKNGGFLAKLRIDKSYINKKSIVFASIVLAGVILTIITIYCIYGTSRDIVFHENEVIPPDPEEPLPPSYSKLRKFKGAAVCADGAPCAVVGSSMLEKNGSAVDAAIATMICNGLVNMQSMGIGGGFFMTIYDKHSKRAYALTARDRAPLKANATMYEGNPEASFTGPLAIAVPGELAGYWEAHKRFGKLPWADLFKPSIELCEEGYNLTKIQYDGFRYNAKSIYEDRILKELFVDPKTNEFYTPGTIIRPKVLCKTFRVIAEKGVSEFYNGTLGELLVQDLQKKGSIITMKDLNNYRATWDEPVQINLTNGMTVFTIDLPASGALLTYILNILNEFNFTCDNLASFNETILTYHRMIEAFKFAYALRDRMGDKEFVDMEELSRNMISKIHAHNARLKIDDHKTWNDPAHYGASTLSIARDKGTAHVSILGPDGDAVSATSTIHFYFGSGVVSESTGILMNNAMDDFGIPSTTNYFGIPASPNNYIAPGKRPLSSITPSILVDSKGNVRMVIGGAGGPKITTAVAQVIARIIWMGQSVKEAVDAPRIHHQLYPPEVAYEYGVPKQLISPIFKNISKKVLANLLLVRRSLLSNNIDCERSIIKKLEVLENAFRILEDY